MVRSSEIGSSAVGLKTSQNDLLRARRTETGKIGETDANLFGAINDASIGNRSTLTGRQDCSDCNCCQREDLHNECGTKGEAWTVGNVVGVCVKGGRGRRGAGIV